MREFKAKLPPLVPLVRMSLWATALFALTLPTWGASFDCTKQNTKVEAMICNDSDASRADEDMALAYLRALERTNTPERIRSDQKHWLHGIRNVCQDAQCVYMANVRRAKELDSVPTRKCYWLEPPDKTDSGDRPRVEQVCRVLDKNLNQFCSQPPMVCGLKIAPEFHHQLMRPNWVSLSPDARLVEEFLRAPWRDSSVKGAEQEIWDEQRPIMEAALRDHRLSLSEAELDLYNLGKPQKAYRLDYGMCPDSPQLDEPNTGRPPAHISNVTVQFAPEIVRPLYRKYFPMDDGRFNEVFLYERQAYDYIMTEPSVIGERLFVVNRRRKKMFEGDKRPVLLAETICVFHYQPLEEATK